MVIGQGHRVMKCAAAGVGIHVDMTAEVSSYDELLFAAAVSEGVTQAELAYIHVAGCRADDWETKHGLRSMPVEHRMK